MKRAILGRVVPVLAALCVGAAALATTGAEGQDAPVAQDRGWFHVECGLVKTAPVDPIVFLGQADVSHEHSFFGSRGINENSTNEQLMEYNSTCISDTEEKQPGIIAKDRGAYWAPTAYDSAGRVPTHVTAGYGIGFRERDLTAFPPGFRMIAGDSSGKSSSMAGAQRIYFYHCPGGTIERGSSTVAPTCATNELRNEIRFPDFWDGEHLDSPNHKSHGAYSQKVGDLFVCPASHPVQVPQLRLRIKYASDGGPDFKLQTGSGAARALGGINTTHADQMHGWDQEAFEQRVEVCLEGDVYCGGTASKAHN